MQPCVKLPEAATNVPLKNDGRRLTAACVVVALEMNPVKTQNIHRRASWNDLTWEEKTLFYHTASVEMQSFRNCALLTFQENIAQVLRKSVKETWLLLASSSCQRRGASQPFLCSRLWRAYYLGTSFSFLRRKEGEKGKVSSIKGS